MFKYLSDYYNFDISSNKKYETCKLSYHTSLYCYKYEVPGFAMILWPARQFFSQALFPLLYYKNIAFEKGLFPASIFGESANRKLSHVD